MNLDLFGVFRVTPNGTIFSYDRQKVVINSRKITGGEFKAMTGCDMVTPGMSLSAELETESACGGILLPVAMSRSNETISCLRGRKFVELDAGKLGNAPLIVVGSVW